MQRTTGRELLFVNRPSRTFQLHGWSRVTCHLTNGNLALRPLHHHVIPLKCNVLQTRELLDPKGITPKSIVNWIHREQKGIIKKVDVIQQNEKSLVKTNK